MLGEQLGSVRAKERIGYLPENHRYPLYLTGEEVLNYFGKLSGVSNPELGKRIDATLELVGMRDWRKTKVRKYSKGMMQRLGLAQALMNEPDLIMLDEPTDGVDPVGRKEIRDILVHLKDRGKTIFLNSHLLSEVERISDRVAIMDHGKLIRQGSVNDLVAAPDRYEIHVGIANDEAAAAILGAAILKHSPGVFETTYATSELLNAAIDQLRHAGIMIESFSAKRASLEELFFELVQSSDLKRQ